MKKPLSKEEQVLRARRTVESASGDSETKRPWLVSEEVRCFGDRDHSTQVHVLQGTPARGHVLVIENGGRGSVIAFTFHGRFLRSFGYKPDARF